MNHNILRHKHLSYIIITSDQVQLYELVRCDPSWKTGIIKFSVTYFRKVLTVFIYLRFNNNVKC